MDVLGRKLISEIPSKSSTVKPLFGTHLAQYHLGHQYDDLLFRTLLALCLSDFQFELYFVL